MTKRVRFVLHRANFRKQVLRGDGVADYLLAALGPDAQLSVSPSRVRARAFGSMEEEAQTGALQRRLGIDPGELMVMYTTKSGKQRLATQKQVANWTRGGGR